jgi:hypothetical protein
MTQGKNFTQEDVDDLIESAKQMENLPPSEEMIKFTKAVQDNGGDNFAFLKTLADFDDDVNSFKVLAETGIRSFVGMGKAAYEEPLLTAATGVFSGIAGGPTATVVGAMSVVNPTLPVFTSGTSIFGNSEEVSSNCKSVSSFFFTGSGSFIPNSPANSFLVPSMPVLDIKSKDKSNTSGSVHKRVKNCPRLPENPVSRIPFQTISKTESKFSPY